VTGVVLAIAGVGFGVVATETMHRRRAEASDQLGVRSAPDAGVV
jgi:hypothetical protein